MATWPGVRVSNGFGAPMDIPCAAARKVVDSSKVFMSSRLFVERRMVIFRLNRGGMSEAEDMFLLACNVWAFRGLV